MEVAVLKAVRHLAVGSRAKFLVSNVVGRLWGRWKVEGRLWGGFGGALGTL